MTEVDDIVIVARGKTLSGHTVITYFIKGVPELKHIKFLEVDKK